MNKPDKIKEPCIATVPEPALETCIATVPEPALKTLQTTLQTTEGQSQTSSQESTTLPQQELVETPLLKSSERMKQVSN